MKKIDLLHTTVLIVAILCGYSALQHFLSILNVSVYYSDVFISGGGTTIIPTLFQATLYTIACIILVRNSKRIATWLLGNERPEFEEFAEGTETKDPDALKWHLNRQSILFALFIGIGLYTLVQNTPILLSDLVFLFRERAGSGALDLIRPRQRDQPVLDALRVTIGALLIYAAPALTNYLEKTIAGRLHDNAQNS